MPSTVFEGNKPDRENNVLGDAKILKKKRNHDPGESESDQERWTPDELRAAANGAKIIFPGTRIFRSKEPLMLDCGKILTEYELAYETYGELNDDRSNAILICHALSGSAHVFSRTGNTRDGPGKYKEKVLKGWWDPMGDPGAAFDTTRYFVICINVLGGCYGSTGPASPNPETGKPYALDFPVVTIGDMVKAQHALIDHLGIEQLLCVAGGSMGGMQALDWAIRYPDQVRSVLPIATACVSSTQNIAFHDVGRQCIISDPDWNQGNYYPGEGPVHGLSIARRIGHITYLSEASMHMKFGRRLQDSTTYKYEFTTDFAVESYLDYKGNSFTRRFDANSYLYITKAIDYFDLTNGGEISLVKAFENVTASFLVISFSSDWLYPPSESKRLVKALKANTIDVSSVEIQSDYGHDAFLLEHEVQGKLIRNFLKRVEKG